jgi:hypothetical protein
MAASTTYSKIVHVKIEQGKSGAYFASSPDLEGLMVVSHDRQELIDNMITRYIEDLYRAVGHPVVASPMEPDDGDEQPWVAMPLEAAKQGLTRQHAD